jgi:hypothetical protein
MDNSRFSIFEAVRSAYVFVGREWLYLLKAGLLPMGMQVIASLFVQYQRAAASLIEGYLWGLPATTLFAWFMFLEARLLLLGERVDRLPQERAYLLDRLHCMKLTVMIAVLFNMGMAVALALLAAIAGGGQWGVSWPATISGLFIIGGIFWSLRFGLVPILAAVRYPIRPVLRQTWGMMFSLRLFGMAMTCLFPVVLLFQILVSAFIPAATDPLATGSFTAAQQLAIIAAGAPLSLLVAALLTAAGTSALRQILGTRRDGVLI